MHFVAMAEAKWTISAIALTISAVSGQYFFPISDSYFPDTNKPKGMLAQEANKYVCGPKAFCNKTLAERIETICSFECNGCNCDEMCHFFGDCCPDALFTDSSEFPSTPHGFVSCFKTNWTLWGVSDSVFMVTKCPETTDSLTATRCHKPDITDQEQAAPVSNRNITYKNKYCARCHDVRDLDIWRHQVTCRNTRALASARSTEELWRLVLKENSFCTIVTNPPQGTISRNCRSVDIDRCNVTGMWFQEKPKIKDLCGLYNHSVDYYGNKPYYTSYRNLFCAICNGVEVTTNVICTRVSPPQPPYPMSVLLNFNPPIVPHPNTDDDQAESTSCDSRQIYDPIMIGCREISCPERRVIRDDGCIVPFSTISGLGFKFDVVLGSYNQSAQPLLGNLSDVYYSSLMEALDMFAPLVISTLKVMYLTNEWGSDRLLHDKFFIHAEVFTLSNRSLLEMEETLWDFMHQDQTYPGREDNRTIWSCSVHCRDDFLSVHQVVRVEELQQSMTNLDTECQGRNCQRNMADHGVGLSCPFLEYNTSSDNFTFDDETSSITVNNVTVELNSSRVVHCGYTLKLCTDVIALIQKEILKFCKQRRQSEWTMLSDANMSTFSSVCISLSLFCLMLTFVTYIYLKRLNGVPALNTVSLVFCLFWAQLFFLVGSKWTDNTVVCKTLGIVIHFLWLATFSWMSVSAYHIFSVFTKFRPPPSSGKIDFSTFYKYALFCVSASLFVVLTCVAYYLIRSDGTDIGYGGNVCFIREPASIGVFFGAPLIAMLTVNGVFFTLTVLSVRSVQNAVENYYLTDRHHAFIYLKLSLLFGFTWVFGLFAALLRSITLWYTFIMLSGCQGVFLFIAFCVNRRTFVMAKSRFRESRNGFSPPSELSKQHKHTKPTQITLPTHG